MNAEPFAIKEGTPVSIQEIKQDSTLAPENAVPKGPINSDAKNDKFLFCINIERKAETCCCKMITLKVAAFLIMVTYIISGVIAIFVEIFSDARYRTPIGNFENIVCILLMFVSILGIYGIKKKNSRFIKILYIMMIFNYFANTITTIMAYDWITIIINCILRTALNLYFLFIVYSYYYHLANGNFILAENGREMVKIIEQINKVEQPQVVQGVAMKE